MSNKLIKYFIHFFHNRSPPTARKQSGNQQATPSPNCLTTPAIKSQRSRSPTPQPQKKLQFNDTPTEKTNNSVAFSTSPHLLRRSESPSPRRIPDFQKRKQHSLDSNTSAITSNQNQIDNVIEEVQKTDLSGINEVTGKSDNISDNGSEISDEGYRSLGLIQTNNKRASLHSEASNDEVDSTIRSNDNDVQTSTESPGSELSSKLNDSSPDTLEREVTPKNNFEYSGIHIDDDEITVDISSTTGLRKTGFSNNLYDNDGNIKKSVSKIPKSPLPARRKSVDNSNVISPPQTPNTTGQPLNRKLPVYRSVRKLNRNEITSPPATPKVTATNKKEGISTWSGRAATKSRSSLSPSTYQQPTSSSFNRNSATRSSSSNLYDKSVRRNSKSSSVNTSPVKKSMSPSSSATSPLAQEILQVAGNYKNDKEILEKMKVLLNKYTKNTQQSPLPEFDDFTARWVISSGSPDIGQTVVAHTSPKSISKRTSTVSLSESTNSKDIASVPASTQPRKDHRGCSKIPAPVRLNNTEIY